ncbi:hypothetical protein [Burkholderia sp. D-99]|uniref:hypothetical protein n=1 Tax=Burkholderia sp. D-99 TaxID=2717316 RepID=UPI0014247CD5|nr:hypothetical protein [Burkholderia sp. D-99]NHV27594.1 hypothetical protein [Burkholderia sp. D-99]
MDDIKHPNDFPPLSIEQIRDLAKAMREDFGGILSRADFTESLLMLLEDIPGFEFGEADTTPIESAWAEYNSRHLDS